MRRKKNIIEKKHYPFTNLLFLLLVLSFTPVTTTWSKTIADEDISDQVESRIFNDPSVPSFFINVNTYKGIVTLAGTVNNILAKERATRIAETIRGTRSVINRIKVKPTFSRSANWLKLNVRNALFYDVVTESKEIKVLANDKGQVTLIGEVDSWAERDLAVTVAKGVSGVTGVNNKITIKSSNIQRFDKEIKSEIEKRLQWDTLVDDAMINVRVNEGEVDLSGVVGSAAEKRRAGRAAWVSGVNAVDTSVLEVKKWKRDQALRNQKYVYHPDLEVRSAVQDALLLDPRVNSSDINVKVKGGYVSLKGIVDNIRAEKAAINDARNTVGVFGVKSIIKIRPIANIGDKIIAENIRNALLQNSIVERYEISVRVKDQVVYLTGSVDSYFEKGTAENIAFQSKGIMEVRNNLIVNYPKNTTYNPYVHDWAIYDYPWYYGGVSKFTLNKSDREIKNNIENELQWSPYVDSKNITISVEDGIATLTGTVDSIRENEAAEESALEGGAKSFINRLKIRLINDRLNIGKFNK